MTIEEQLAALKAANEKLKSKLAAQSTISFKVSENKKCVSVYGLGRRPCTLYGSQMLRLLEKADELKAWIEAHRSELAWKDDDKE